MPPARTRLAQINLQGYAKIFLEDVCADVIRSAKKMEVQTSGIIRLPTRIQKFGDVLRSPFVHKGAVDQYEIRHHGRLIELYGDGATSADATKVVHFLRYLEHTILPAHQGTARARIMLFSHEKYFRVGTDPEAAGR
ncbi:hypothetical protein AB1Y20_023353 [Prymnesium parvum]|uniref:Small ribosomal subunit protein uS10 domain-containing protein n=1 Tax=Prymnesium parvum TaxID=97485 RepID=A0AB34JG46_PRYPA|mmetsp:Transcript_3293/g.8183  ORF Transcript_3293/g.8183 Transcript_3293/m.8183 type:complete len:137 (+) Transcript_3293:63-473(+)